MAKIVSIILKNFPYVKNSQWQLEVIRDDDYSAKEIKNTDEVSDSIKNIVDFVEKSKDPALLEKERIEKQQKEMLQVLIDNTDPIKLLDLVNMFPLWERNKEYDKGDFVNYNNKLFIVKENHTAGAGTNPALSKAYYTDYEESIRITNYAKNMDGTYRDLETNPYEVGEKMIWTDGFKYMYIDPLLKGNNNPESNPTSWQKIEE